MVAELSLLTPQPAADQRRAHLDERVRGSAAAFQGQVWPQVSAIFGPGRLAQVEALEADCAKALDLLGIDYLFTPSTGEAFGIASRVQAPDRSGRPWNSFTMGAGQYCRLRAVGETGFGRLVPAVVVHAFIDEQPRVLSVGVARVRDLVDTPPTGSHHGPSGAFYTWSFDHLRRAGRLIARLPDPVITDPFASLGSQVQARRAVAHRVNGESA